MSKHTDWMALHAILAREIDAYLAGLAAGSPELHSYALADVGQIPEMRDTYLDRMEIPHAKLFAGTKEHKIAKYGPMLIPLDSNANSSQLPISQLLHGMQYGWTVSWLTSPLGLEELSKHFAGHFNGVFEDGREVLIRYYDPRNLAPFLESVDADTKDALLEPISTWTYWDRNLILQTITGSGMFNVAGIRSTHITSQTKDALANAATPDLIMSKLFADSDLDAYDDWLPHTLYRAITTIMTASEKYGVRAFEDVYLFVSLAINVHPEFYRIMPIFINIQKDIQSGTTTMLDTVLATKDEEWNIVDSLQDNACSSFSKSIHKALVNGR